MAASIGAFALSVLFAVKFSAYATLAVSTPISAKGSSLLMILPMLFGAGGHPARQVGS
jgi:hypothetical protein